MPKTKIAQMLGRDRSTITRGVKRNWWHDKDVPQADGYWHVTAQSQADRRRSRRRKLERLPDLRAEAIRCLQEGWSPEQIAGRLRIERGAPHRLCHETIYQYVYSAEGQSAQLARLLPERRRKRKPRYARTPPATGFFLWKQASTTGRPRSTIAASSEIGRVRRSNQGEERAYHSAG